MCVRGARKPGSVDDVVAEVAGRPFLQGRRRRRPQAALRGRAGRASSLRRTSRLAPGGVCPAADVTTGAVRSYRTVSPLPCQRPKALARRSLLCGTFLRVTPTGRSPAPLPCGARTFLPLTTTSVSTGGRLDISGTRRLRYQLRRGHPTVFPKAHAASHCAGVFHGAARDGSFVRIGHDVKPSLPGTKP